MTIDAITLKSLSEDIVEICKEFLQYPVSLNFKHQIKTGLEKEFVCKYPELEYKIKFESVPRIQGIKGLKTFFRHPIQTFLKGRETILIIYVMDWYDDSYEILKFLLSPMEKSSFKKVVKKA